MNVDALCETMQQLNEAFFKEEGGSTCPLAWLGETVECRAEDLSRSSRWFDLQALLNAVDGVLADRLDHEDCLAFNAHCFELLIMDVATNENKGQFGDGDGILRLQKLSGLCRSMYLADGKSTTNSVAASHAATAEKK